MSYAVFEPVSGRAPIALIWAKIASGSSSPAAPSGGAAGTDRNLLGTRLSNLLLATKPGTGGSGSSPSKLRDKIPERLALTFFLPNAGDEVLRSRCLVTNIGAGCGALDPSTCSSPTSLASWRCEPAPSPPPAGLPSSGSAGGAEGFCCGVSSKVESVEIRRLLSSFAAKDTSPESPVSAGSCPAAPLSPAAASTTARGTAGTAGGAALARSAWRRCTTLLLLRAEISTAADGTKGSSFAGFFVGRKGAANSSPLSSPFFFLLLGKAISRLARLCVPTSQHADSTDPHMSKGASLELAAPMTLADVTPPRKHPTPEPTKT
mmetsp:Transcript_20014/g.42994  ORF Transcript_20014/g.42994 Transcript_20014/m.42994 type:complete len:320 (+) Transcript_20014:482-1441(+)